MRNIFQVFHDMMKAYVGEGVDEYPDDPESIQYAYYDCSKLFVEGTDNPFFADRLFANRLVKLVEALAGFRYETVWRFDRKIFGQFRDYEAHPILKQLSSLLEDSNPALTDSTDNTGLLNSSANSEELLDDSHAAYMAEDYVEVPCPSHDNPLLMISKHYRREFFDDLFKNDKFKWQLSTEKEFEWVFRAQPCTICSSLYEALLSRLKSPQRVFEMLYARPYRFSRRLGEGISVFNPW
jgi:hypothetical protein